jgi:hypothetical protein
MMLIDFCVGKQTTKMKDSEVWVGKKGRKQKGLIENFTLGNKEEK